MTREEAIKQLSDAEHCLAGHGDLWDEDMEAFDMAIEALKQETVSRESYYHEYFLRKEYEVKIDKLQRQFDKIRAEIEALPKTYPFVNHIDMYVKVSDVEKIIDKYKAEMESEE